MAMIVVSTEPITEAKPLTAQPQATYSAPWSVEAGHRAEAERHEHAEADAERGQHHEGHDDPHGERRGQQGVGERRQQRTGRPGPAPRSAAASTLARAGSTRSLNRALSSAPTPVKISSDASVTVSE